MLEYFIELKSQYASANIEYLQSNHEGFLIDTLHEWGFRDNTTIILNAGGYTHTSIALADAVTAISNPVIEIHISNILEREEFRHHSYLTKVCVHHIIGQGIEGYRQAIEWILNNEEN